MTALIEIRDLKYRYPDGREALQGVNLDVHQGESVGIIGANGAGKTTLLLHLNGILKGQGTVRVLGREMVPSNLRFIRSTVAFVFQNPDEQLFSPTVFEDVSFGPLHLGLEEDEVRRRTSEALAAVGMTGYEAAAPHHLSAGEKKRIAIATALSIPCEAVVLDEPTSTLDPKARAAMIALLQGLPRTKIIAGHDLELIALTCSRTVVLEKGKVALEGKTEEILPLSSVRRTLPGTLSKYFS